MPDEPDNAPASTPISDAFNRAAQWTSQQCGRASSFAIACATIVIWGVSGPVFHYSDTWQLIINTGTTIITFLMVFLIQNTQNRDMTVLHLKLDELIRVSETARNKLLDLDGVTEDELKRLKSGFARLAGGASQNAALRGAAEDLDNAGTGIHRAAKKVASAIAEPAAPSPDAATPSPAGG